MHNALENRTLWECSDIILCNLSLGFYTHLLHLDHVIIVHHSTLCVRVLWPWSLMPPFFVSCFAFPCCIVLFILYIFIGMMYASNCCKPVLQWVKDTCIPYYSHWVLTKADRSISSAIVVTLHGDAPVELPSLPKPVGPCPNPASYNH